MFVPASTSLRLGALLGALLAAGCGPSAGNTSAGTATGTGGGGATGGGAAGGEGGGGGQPPGHSPLHVSFVEETAPGQAPALLRLANETTTTLTFGIDRAFFELVPPGITTDPQLAASDSVLEDTAFGFHEGPPDRPAPCVWLELSSIDGPDVLAPGFSYTLQVTFTEEAGYEVALLEEGAAEVFTAVRPRIHDPVLAPSWAFSELSFSLGGAHAGASMTFPELYDAHPGAYMSVGSASLEIASIRFTDKTKVVHGKQVSVLLPSAVGLGFTAVVAESPVDGALATVELERL